jgi:FlaA1/EpsC-like NDP-sugar epimerase
LGTLSSIDKIIKEYFVTEVIIAIPSASHEVLNSAISSIRLADLRIAIHIVPSGEKYFEAVPIVPSLEELTVFDLTGRDEYSIDIDTIKHKYAQKTVLITGAGGSIGSELCRQLIKFGVKTIICVGRGENSIYELAKSLKLYVDFMENPPEVVYCICDVRDKIGIKKIFDQHKPQIVFHAAAHKHVPMMEYNSSEAVSNNAGGTLNILETCCESNYENDCKNNNKNVEEFVFISTDKAVRPVNVMGATKRLAELIVGYFGKYKNIKTVTVRFGNVLGSRGSVIPLFMEQIKNGGPVTVTHPEVTRYFMSISEAALLTINASAISNGSEIYVLDMGKQFKICDIAEKLIELYGLKPNEDIKITFTGLRAGEKLYEELFYEDKKLNLTSNRKIMYLNDECQIDDEQMETIVKNIETVKSASDEDVRMFLKKMVNEYNYSKVSFQDMRIVN